MPSRAAASTDRNSGPDRRLALVRLDASAGVPAVRWTRAGRVRDRGGEGARRARRRGGAGTLSAGCDGDDPLGRRCCTAGASRTAREARTRRSRRGHVQPLLREPHRDGGSRRRRTSRARRRRGCARRGRRRRGPDSRWISKDPVFQLRAGEDGVGRVRRSPSRTARGRTTCSSCTSGCSAGTRTTRGLPPRTSPCAARLADRRRR